MTSPMPQRPNEKPSGFASRSEGRSTAYGCMNTALLHTEADSRLNWLDLHTRPPVVHRALITLFTEAMQETSDARRAGRFLLSLWSPGQYPLDLNELGFFEREANFAVRHLANFIIGCGISFRQIVTHSQMEPVIAAWGGDDV